MESHHHHPYVPKDLNLPDYVPVLLSQSTILGVYGISSLLVVSFIWILSGNKLNTHNQNILHSNFFLDLFVTLSSSFALFFLF